MLENYKKVYKSFLKRKVNLTTAAMVAVLLGTNAFAAEMKEVGSKNLSQHEVVDPKVTVAHLLQFIEYLDNNKDQIKEEIKDKITEEIKGELEKIWGKIVVALGDKGVILDNDKEFSYEDIKSIIGVTVLGGNNNTINADKIEAILGSFVKGDGNTITVGELKTVIGAIVDGEGNTITLGGKEETSSSTIIGALIKGDSNTLINNSDILGVFGAIVKGDENTVENNGTIISAGIGGIGGTAIDVTGDGNTVENNGTIISAGILNGEIAAIKFVSTGELESTITNNSFILGASIDLVDGNLVLGKTIGIDAVGKNIHIENGNILAGKVGVLVVTGDESIGINSNGHGGSINNGSLILNIGLNIPELLENLGGIAGGDVSLDFILDSLGGDSTGIAINSIGDGKIISNTMAIAGTGINSLGNGNEIDNKLMIIGSQGIVSKGDGNTITNSGIDLGGILDGILNALDPQLKDLLGGLDLSTGISAKDVGIASSGNKNRIYNKGAIKSEDGTGIISEGNENEIYNEASIIGISQELATLIGGNISGKFGIISSKDENKIYNNGMLTVSDVGIKSHGNFNKIFNNGVSMRDQNSDAIVAAALGGIFEAKIGIESIGHRNEIINAIEIKSSDVGIVSSGDSNKISNTYKILKNKTEDKKFPIIGIIPGSPQEIKAAIIESDIGIQIIGQNNQIVNEGKISGNTGIKISGDKNHIFNSGYYLELSNGTKKFVEAEINSELAMDISGNENNITNAGKILGKSGILISGNGNTVDNSGKIELQENENSFGIKIQAESGITTVNNNGISSLITAKGFNSTAIDFTGSGFTLNNSGEIKTTGNDSIAVKASGDNIKIENSNKITSEGESVFALNLNGNNITLFNLANGNILAKGNGVTGVNIEGTALTLKNLGSINIQGDNGIGINAKVSSVGKSGSSILNNGNITVSGIKGIGIKGDGALSVINKNNITINGDNGTGILVLNGASGTNRNFLTVEGTNGTGILALNGATGTNNGTITLEEMSSKGLWASGAGSHVVNNGTIKLGHIHKNDLSDEELADLKGNAIGADVNSSFVNNGVLKNSYGEIIYAGGDHILNVYSESKNADNFVEVIDSEYYQIKDIDLKTAVRTDKTVEITGTLLNGEFNATTDFQNGVSETTEKFLVRVENDGSTNSENALTINGVLNTAKYGVDITKGATAILKGSINGASGLAAALNSESSLAILGGNIEGDIEFRGNKASLIANNGFIKGDIKNSTAAGSNSITLTNGTRLDGSIDLTFGTGDNSITITEGASFAGDIKLGAGNDKLTVDSSSGNLISETSIIDGGEGKDILNLGTYGMITIVKGTIQNFDTQNFQGDIFLAADSNIKTGVRSSDSISLSNSSNSTYGDGNINIGKGANLVLGIKHDTEDNGRDFNHSLTDIGGNKISGEGTLFADTRELNIGKNGIRVDLNNTDIELAAEQIKATQFIYDVAFVKNQTSKFNGTALDISINRDVANMGINSKYQDVWNSIVAAGQETSIVNTTTDGTASDLEFMMYQAKERNIYSLGTKLAHDSMKLYEFGTESFKASPEAGKWLTQAKGIGSYDSNEHSTEFNTTGALVAGEYGISNSSSVGLSFGAGKQQAKFDDFSSKLEADTFYVGAYGKHKMDNFRFIAGAGYQHNRNDATNISANSFDRFENSDKFSNNGFNLFGKVGYIHELQDGMRFEPHAGVAFNYLKQNSVDEGSKDWAISTDSSTSKTTDFKIGFDLVKEFSGDNTKGEAFLTLGHRFTAGDRDNNLTARFNGAETSNYTVDGFELDKNLTSVGAGVDIENVNGFFYGASYSYEFNNRAKNHKVGIGLGYKF